MGKGSSQTIGYRYYLGIQAWLCFGVIDAVKQLRFREQTAWQGDAEGGEQIVIDKPNLLGGDDSEGGVGGTIDVEDGNTSQTANSYLTTIYEGTVPAFRAISQLVFRAFYWGNNPFLGAWDAVVERIDKSGWNGATQWYPAKARILGDVLPAGDAGDPEYDATYPGSLGSAVQVSGSWGPQVWDMLGSSYAVVSADPATAPAILGSAGYDDGYYLAIGGSSARQGCSFYVDLEALAGSDYDIEARVVGDMARTSSSFTLHGASLSVVTAGSVADFSGADNHTTEVQVNGPGQTQQGWQSYDSGWAAVSSGKGAVGVSASGGAAHCFRNVRLMLRGDISTRLYDMNPAHIIRECLTDQHFGRRLPTARINDTNFTAAADTLYAETFGLSFKHDPSRESPDDLIRKVERAADLRRYTNRNSGLFEIKLIRDDYDAGTIPAFTADNVVDATQSYAIRENPFDLPNSVTVPFWDWSRHGMASLTDNDPAKVADDGGVDTTEADIEGITNATLAAKVLSRELVASTIPKLTGTVYLDRTASTLHPGDVFKVTDSRIGLAGEVLRVLEVDEGNGIDSRVRVQFVQDKFSLGTATVSPEDRPTDSVVTGPADATNRLIIETPYYLIARAVGDSTAQDELANDPTMGYILAGAVSPGGNHIRANVMVDDGGGYARQDVIDFMPGPTLTADVSALPTATSLTVSSDAGLDLVSTPALVAVGSEIMSVTAISGTTLTVGRGCLDTIPAAHSTGDRVYFFGPYGEIVETEYNDGDSINVKLQTVTGGGILALADATATALEFDARANRPYPAAKLQLEGSYAPTEVSDGDSLTWAHRDRLTQTTEAIYDWTDGDLGPEAGVSYRIETFAIDSGGVESGTAYWSTTTASNSLTLSAANYASGAPSDAREARFKVTAYRGTSPEYTAWQSPSFVLPILEPLAAEDGSLFSAEDGETLLVD